MKIQHKLFLLILLPVILIIILFAGYIILHYNTTIRKQAREYIEKKSTLQAQIVKGSLDHDMDIVRDLAHIIQRYVLFLPPRQRRVEGFKITKSLFIANRQLTSLYITGELNLFDGLGRLFKNTYLGSDAGRYAIGIYWNNGKLAYEDGTLTEKNILKSSWYREPKINNRETALDPYWYTYTGDKKNSILMTSLLVPYYSSKGKYAGAAGADISLKKIQAIIAKIKVYRSGFAFLITGKGKYLSHPDKKRIGKRIANTKIRLKLLLEQSMKKEVYSIMTKSDLLGTKTITCFAPFSIGKSREPWFLGITVPLDQIYAASNKILIFVIIIVLTGITALFFLIIYFNRKIITNPLDQLVKQADEIGNGNLNYRIDQLLISRQDEMGIVVRSIEKMKSSLNDRYVSLKTTQEELFKSRGFIRGIINSMPSIIIVLDNKLTVTHWNNKAETVTGISIDEALGKNIYQIMPVLSAFDGSIRQCLKSAEEFREIHKDQLPGGRVSHNEITIFPLLQNESHEIVVRIDDVTRQYTLRNQLNQARKLEAIGQLAGGLAHDFNNMLSAIINAVELLKLPARKLDRKSTRYIEMIEKASLNTVALIKKILAFSRKGETIFAPIDLEEVIDESAEILQRTLDKQISLEIIKTDASHRISGDFSSLLNAVLNLCINASHAMPRGGKITMVTKRIAIDRTYCKHSTFHLEPGPYVQLEITDTGCGIPYENLSKIFDPFFTTKEQGEGSGLGLAAVYGTIQDHHGEITVYSEVEVGTSFKIILPLKDNTAYDEPDTSNFIKGRGTILLVDDEEIIRETASELLRELGYTVLVAGDGEAAIRVFSENKSEIDLIIMDMIMPKMNGGKAFRAMKQMDPDCKVILSSGFIKDENIEELQALGLKGFITKPFDNRQLSQIIAALLTDDDYSFFS